MNRLLATIALCIAVAECGTFFQADVKPASTCAREKIRKCVVPNLQQYEDDFATYETVAEFAKNPTNVEDLAKFFEAAQTCVENENQEDVCSGNNQDDVVDDNVNFVADYLKNSFNRELAVNASQSNCLEFDYIIDYVKTDFDRHCFADIWKALEDENQGDFCADVDKLRSCMHGVVYKYCGQAAAEFVDKAFSYGVKTPYGQQWIKESRLPNIFDFSCFN